MPSPESGPQPGPEIPKQTPQTPEARRLKLQTDLKQGQRVVDGHLEQYAMLDADLAFRHAQLGAAAIEANKKGNKSLAAQKRGEQNELFVEFNTQLKLKGLPEIQRAEFVQLARSRRNTKKLEDFDRQHPLTESKGAVAETPREDVGTIPPAEVGTQDNTSPDAGETPKPLEDGTDTTAPIPESVKSKEGEEPIRIPQEMLDGELADAYAHMDIESARRVARVELHGDNPTNPMVEAFNARLAQEGIAPVTHEQYRALARERVLQYSADPERSFLPVHQRKSGLPAGIIPENGEEPPKEGASPEDGTEPPKVEIPGWTEADELGLQSTRTLYADRLRRRSRWRVIFSGSTDEEVISAREAYQALLQQKERRGLDAIKTKFEGKSLADAETMTAMNAEIAGYVLNQHNEENTLREEMHDQTEKSAWQKFRHMWRSSAKARIVLGFALTGSAIVAGATGNIPLALALAGAKGILSGAGTMMATEGAIQLGGERFGLTRRKKDTEAMGEEETAERLAAHGFNYTDKNSKGEFGTRRVTTWRHPLGEADTTAAMLASHYDQIRETGMREDVQRMQREGKSTQEIIGALLNRGLDERLHSTYLTVRERNKKFATRKWLTAVAVGGLTGFLVGEHLAHLQHAQHVPAGGHGPLGETGTPKPGGLPPEAGLPSEHNVSDMVDVHKGDSVWTIVKHQLTERDPNFSHLPTEQQDNMISTLTNRVIENPHAFGLQDADNLVPGQHLDLGPLFHGPGAPDLSNLHEHATQLTSEQIQNIAHNNETLRDWVTAHPHEQLTSERVQDILSAHHGTVDALPHAVEGPAVSPERLPIPLDTHITKDWGQFAKLQEGLVGKSPEAAKAWKQVIALRVGDVKNWKVIHGVLEQQGLPKAQNIAKATFKVLKGLNSQGLIADRETIGNVLERIQTA